MERQNDFNELLGEIVRICEAEKIPFIATYSIGSTVHVVDFQTVNMPDRLKKTITTLMQGVKQTKHVIEIQA
jgi:hypothetical protein